MFMSYEKLMVKKTMKCQINANMARSLKLHFRSYLNKGEGENCQTKRANGRRVSIVYCLYKIQWLDNCIVYEIHTYALKIWTGKEHIHESEYL